MGGRVGREAEANIFRLLSVSEMGRRQQSVALFFFCAQLVVGAHIP